MSDLVTAETLVDDVYAKLDYPKMPIRIIIHAFINCLNAHLANGDPIAINGVGKWIPKKAKQYRVRGKMVERVDYRYMPPRAVERLYQKQLKESK